MIKYYLHTIDGRPAGFDKYQICYANKNWMAKAVKDLKTIRKEQRLTIKFRKKNGHYAEGDEDDYSYVWIGLDVKDKEGVQK